MKLAFSFALVAALLTFGTTAEASTGWQTWDQNTIGTATNPTYGGPFWNNPSGDGISANIGWCLAGGGIGCKMINSPNGFPPFYGDGNNAVGQMGFSNGGAPVTLTLDGINTNQTGGTNGTDYVGWYEITNNKLVMSPDLINSTDALGTTITFTPGTGFWGLYFHNVQSPDKWYRADYYWFTQANYNYATGTGIGHITVGSQHFAVFQQVAGNEYFIGGEDTLNENSDRDFNDLILTMTTSNATVTATPEPGSVALLGAGLLILGGALARRRRLAK